MSDATLIAGELAGISAGMERLASAMAEMQPVINVPPQAPVAVNVPAAEVVVNVPPMSPPVVSVAAPVVNFSPPRPVAWVVRVTERDMDGSISAFTITPA